MKDERFDDLLDVVANQKDIIYEQGEQLKSIREQVALLTEALQTEQPDYLSTCGEFTDDISR